MKEHWIRAGYDFAKKVIKKRPLDSEMKWRILAHAYDIGEGDATAMGYVAEGMRRAFSEHGGSR